MRREIFSENIDNYRLQLYAIAFKILKNETDAEDAVCSAILKAYEHIDELKDMDKLKSWLITITRNEALQLIRKRFALPGNEKVEALVGASYDDHDELWDIVQELNEEYRSVIILYYYGNLSIKEIGEVLNIPIGTVKSRMNRGRDMLKERLPIAKKKKNSKGLFIVVLCLTVLGLVFSLNVIVVRARLFDGFRNRIMDIFTVSDKDTGTIKEPESLGISSEEQNITSKPDLMIELKESIIDKKNIYLLIEVTAPASVEFNEDIAFEYYAFCKGSNYNSSDILGGAKECKLFEVQQNSPNRATYILSLLSVDELIEDSEVTLSLRNLTDKPLSDNPTMLVEGMWGITFNVDYTIREEIMLENNNVEFPFVNTTAKVENIRITPIGMTFMTDVSKFPYDELAITDTSIHISIKMVDGTEYLIESHDFEEITFISSGAVNYVQEGDKHYLQKEYEFEEQIDVNKIMGIYVEDIFIPVN
ncbi:MAG: sigma-70 family RNA polymerase sigma factor [Lachnospiraceae bacterium]|nr:sigma-70 family RNA polymerase sigma factor [Lachnospiraceae bacterium]